MTFNWLNDEECEVRLSEGGEVVLALQFDRSYMRWETQAWPNDQFTPDDVWDEVDLEDSDVRAELQLALERVAVLVEGAVRDAAYAAYELRLNVYRDEIRDLAVSAATRRARSAVRCDCGFGDERWPGAEHNVDCPMYRA